MLHFDNRFCHELPGDPESSNSVRQVEGAFWSAVSPTPVKAPRLLAISSEMAGVLGVRPEDLKQSDWVETLAGNRLMPGMQPFASCYGGHQFGYWAGQLGDGRAISLGEAVDHQGGRQELQLKGAGPTPYSRRADGRAVLRSSLREFLCSEAMHHLGIPTTRALSLVLTGEGVLRDMFYDGHPQVEPGAIVCRVAPSFIRFGHFQLPASRGDTALLRQLLDFVLARDFPELECAPERRIHELFAEVCRRTGLLVARWMQVGFVHGVMNTDNMSILGLTIDYGPYGWLEDFDPGWTPNTTDAEGRRYCFGRQPQIARWNLERLAEALEMLNSRPGSLAAGLEEFDQTYDRELSRLFSGKFGFSQWRPEETELVNQALALMEQGGLDMTEFFRSLGKLSADSPDVDVLSPSAYDPGAWEACRPALADWLARYGARLRQEGLPDGERRQRMNTFNPRYVLRNYLAQQAIDEVMAGDDASVERLLDVLRHPYDEQAGKEAYQGLRPEWARHKPGCSMLSCSS